MCANRGVAYSAEESGPVFLMYSPGARLNWGGRVTLVRCRGCQRDYGNSQPPPSHPTVNSSEVTPSSLPLQPPPAAGLITTPRMMNISTVVQPNWRLPICVERAHHVYGCPFASAVWSQSRTIIFVRHSVEIKEEACSLLSSYCVYVGGCFQGPPPKKPITLALPITVAL